MKELLRKLWPGKFGALTQADTKPPEVEVRACSLIHPPHKQAVIGRGELESRFFLQKDCLLEVAPEDRSQDPAFADEFSHLAQSLKTLNHPAVLRVLDHGREGKRLFRVWENREMDSVLFWESYKPKEFIPVVAGFEALHKLGVKVDRLNPSMLARDSQGIFVARFPWTRKEGYPPQELASPVAINVCLLAKMEDDYSQWFLMHLAALIFVKLTRQMPFVEPPIRSAMQGREPQRTSATVDGKLGQVLERMLSLEAAQQYGSLEQALREVREALSEAGG